MVFACNDWVDGSDVINPDDVVDAVWQGGFYDGNLIGVPSIESFLWYGLNYNAQHVEEAGLDPDDPPLTWEGVFEWHKALSKFDDGGNVTRIGLDPIDAMAGEPDFISLSYGHQWWDDETQAIDLNHELLVQGIEMQAEFFRHIGPDNFAGFRSVEGQGAWGGAFNAQAQSMIHRGVLARGRDHHPATRCRGAQPGHLGTRARFPRRRQDHGHRSLTWCRSSRKARTPKGCSRCPSSCTTMKPVRSSLSRSAGSWGLNPGCPPLMRTPIPASGSTSTASTT